ncbi:MAG: SGNH/GDSL hydrolase family protein [Dermatophilaceae bacterium]
MTSAAVVAAASSPTALANGVGGASATAGRPGWVTAWAAVPSSAVAGVTTGYPGRTFRNVVHTVTGGPRVRIHLSNRLGTEPVLMGRVTVAISSHTGGRRDGTVDTSDGTAQAGTMRDVRFGGSTSVVIPAESQVVSDPVDLTVPADHDLLVSVWTPEPSGTVTYHRAAQQGSFVSPGPADATADLTRMPSYTELTSAWHYVSAVDVLGGRGTVVALGDSITDGVTSTWSANRRWPDELAARLAGPAGCAARVDGVANAGISGNRILADGGDVFAQPGPSVLNRFDADVLGQAGARSVVVLAGINDIQASAGSAEIIAGLSEVAARARAHGLRVVGATITPFQGWGSWTEEREQARAEVNAWIRSGGAGALHAVADTDLALRDPVEPRRLRPDLDSGDHLHPNDVGYAAIAGAVPLGAL